MNLIGGITSLILFLMGYLPSRYGTCFCFEVGKGWGGISLGIFIICEKGSSDKLKNHEFGHSIQNARWGILFPFVIGLPSLSRWLYFRIMQNRKELPDYYSIWFEREASELGEKYNQIW